MVVCRYENEQPFRRAVEEEISSLYRVIEEANMTKAELEEQMENMRAELRSLEHNHEQVVLNRPFCDDTFDCYGYSTFAVLAYLSAD